jgi:uncharacterized protein (DUF58 family)
MFTRSGWSVLVLSAVLIAAGRVLGLVELFVLGATGLVLCAVALVTVRRAPRIEVDRILVPRRVHVGTASRVELRVRNVGRRRTPVLTLYEPVEGTVGAQVAVAPLAAGAEDGASYRLPTERRGLLAVGPLEARRSDAFGLARRRSIVTDRTHLTVLPAVDHLSGLPATGGLDDPLAGAARPLLGTPGSGDFASLRPYVPGDDLRRVHWASTARAGDLLVRQDDPPWQGHVTVLLDARQDRIGAERFEYAVSAAASILSAVALRGDRARLIVTDGTDTGLVDGRGARDTILEHLSVLERHADPKLPDPPLDGRRRTGGLVLIGGRLGVDDLATLRAFRNRFSAIIAIATDGAPPATGPDVTVIEAPAGVAFPAVWDRALEALA